MSITSFDTPEVQITSVYFRNTNTNPGDRVVESFPRRMVYEGREYTFIESGMRFLVQKGQELIKLFDVSDGQTDYRLRLDEANHWTLVGMKAAV